VRRELLRLERIVFSEFGQKTLNDFDLTLYQGEILGVFSNHAAVKNNLVEVIAGRKGAQSGRLYLDGEACSPDVDRERYRKVGLVHAVNTLVDDLSIAENIFVVRKGVKAQVIDQRLITRQTQQLMDEYGLSIEPESPANRLSTVERCSLEIVKAVALGARIVVLQDFSSFLADREIEQLLGLAALLKGRGLGFLLVDSSSGHLARYADRVVVINKGRNFWVFARHEITERVLKSCFSRDPLIDLPDDGDTPEAVVFGKSVALSFERVHSGPLDALSFTLRQGEELCIFDQDGKGIDEIRALLGGERRPESGRVLVDGKLFTARNSWQALAQDVAFVVENPAESMLFPDFTALENLCLPTARKTPDFWINPVYLESCLREYSPFFDAEALKKYPDELSPQDLHKLVYCRWHLFNPKLVVCVKPFSSVEKSLEEISAFFIGLLLKKGIAVLVLTSNVSETGSTARKISLNQKNAPVHPKNAL
jgi:ribose transport system ATP-binding protein